LEGEVKAARQGSEGGESGEKQECRQSKARQSTAQHKSISSGTQALAVSISLALFPVLDFSGSNQRKRG
jgi:hypothetical protein